MKRKLPKEAEPYKFKKGKSGNPLGAQLHNKELKEVRALTHKQVGEIATMVLQGDIEGLKAVKDSSDATVLKVWFAAVAVKGIQSGDFSALSALLDRILGKVPEQYKIQSQNENTNSVSVQVVRELVAKLESEN